MSEHLIRFDADKALRLKVSYDKAIESRADQFEFEGSTFLTSYAKYVLEYLRQRGVLHA
jgi:hypothetical protein